MIRHPSTGGRPPRVPTGSLSRVGERLLGGQGAFWQVSTGLVSFPHGRTTVSGKHSATSVSLSSHDTMLHAHLGQPTLPSLRLQQWDCAPPSTGASGAHL